MKGSIIAAALVAAAGAAAAQALTPQPPVTGHIELVVDGTPFGPLTQIVLRGAQPNAESEAIVLTANGSEHPKVMPQLPKSPSVTFVAIGHLAQIRTAMTKWRRMVVLGQVAQSKKTLELDLVDYNGAVQAAWTIQNAWPSKMAVTTTTAGAEKLTVTLTAEGILRKS
jgi:phage tail-like protein